MAFPKHTFPAPDPAGSCLDFGQDKVLVGEATRRGCRRPVIELQPLIPLKACWKCKREKKLDSLSSTGKAA